MVTFNKCWCRQDLVPWGLHPPPPTPTVSRGRCSRVSYRQGNQDRPFSSPREDKESLGKNFSLPSPLTPIGSPLLLSTLLRHTDLTTSTPYIDWIFSSPPTPAHLLLLYSGTHTHVPSGFDGSLLEEERRWTAATITYSCSSAITEIIIIIVKENRRACYWIRFWRFRFTSWTRWTGKRNIHSNNSNKKWKVWSPSGREFPWMWPRGAIISGKVNNSVVK